jgi:NTP pyrophosphatase (non-canonical NTP hydrolase)
MPSWISSTPNSRSRSATKAAVSWQSKPSSGCACRCAASPHLLGIGGDAVDHGHGFLPAGLADLRRGTLNQRGPRNGQNLGRPGARPRRRNGRACARSWRRLRDPETGCPWDIEQDFASIAPYTIEEAYEVADAIEREAWDELKGELGDLLLQTVYHTQMAEEAGLFDFDEVADAIADKMVARHPHVFGDESRDKSAEQQTRDWEAIKAAERAAKAAHGVLDDVALACRR